MEHRRINERISKHVEMIQKMFNLPYSQTNSEALVFFKKIRLLENRAHKLAERWCNGKVSEFAFEKGQKSILTEIDEILHYSKKEIKVIFNSDPRGYALKIEEEKLPPALFKDWGGFGIIAPDFREG